MMDAVADAIARTLQLLELLQSSHQRTVAELAERLGADERTVRRDVARLSGAGVRVESVRGRYGGYRLASGRRVLPVTFSGEEVVAVFLGLAHAQARAGEPEVAVQTAMAKIKRAMRPGEAERVEAALGVMTGDGRRADAVPDPGVMLVLAEAARLRRGVELRYRSGAGVPSRRVVRPYGLVAHSGRWYLVALDTEKGEKGEKGEERAFRVDRVLGARLLAETFDGPRHFDGARWLVEHFAGADYRWKVVLRVRASEARVRAHLPPSVARVEEGAYGPGLCRVVMHAESLEWIPSVIAALDCEVVIESPEELRERVRGVASRMLDAAGGADR